MITKIFKDIVTLDINQQYLYKNNYEKHYIFNPIQLITLLNFFSLHLRLLGNNKYKLYIHNYNKNPLFPILSINEYYLEKNKNETLFNKIIIKKEDYPLIFDEEELLLFYYNVLYILNDFIEDYSISYDFFF